MTGYAMINWLTQTFFGQGNKEIDAVMTVKYEHIKSLGASDLRYSAVLR